MVMQAFKSSGKDRRFRWLSYQWRWLPFFWKPAGDIQPQRPLPMDNQFVIRVRYDPQENCWFVNIPQLQDGVLTHGDSLPEALAMAGDAARGLLEMMIEYGQWPPEDQTG